MNVQAITMDPRIARIHYKDYMDRCRKHRAERKAKLDAEAKATGRELRRIQIAKSRIEKEDRELLLAYKALLKAGTRLIHLPSAIRDGGWTTNWLPKLAVARANAQWVNFHTGNEPWFSGTGAPYNNKESQVISFNPEIFPSEVRHNEWRKNNHHPTVAKALVPTVPPTLRPDNLSEYHILWEAEWTFMAPGDPILLKQVNKDMFSIVAQWDLTPLEQRILESRKL